MDEQIEQIARKLAMFLFDTYGDAEGVVWAGLTNAQRDEAMSAARAAHSVMAGTIAGLTEARDRVAQVRGGYVSQMKFCDIEAMGYFREFARRIDAALAPPRQE